MNRIVTETTRMNEADTLAELAAITGAGGVISDPGEMARYLNDWSGDQQGSALAAIRPASIEQTQAIVRLCGDLNIAMIPQGGNTGLVSGAIAKHLENAVVVSLERLNEIRDLDAGDFTITVDAGCTLQQIRDAAEAENCLFPLSLGAQGSCQIGGNAATNAGGVNVLRYGMARDLILGLEVVLPDGSIWKGLSGLRKDNRGYDLKQLFIGSEGTLGIITGLKLKLFPKPSRVETAYLGVRAFDDAMRLFAKARHACSDLMTGFEVIGSECIDQARLTYPDLLMPVATEMPVHILMEVSASGEIDVRHLIEDFLSATMNEGLIADAVLAESEAQARTFWAIREALVEGQARRGYHVRTDVSVALSQIPSLIERGRAIVATNFPGWLSQAYGHAGDGNIHFNVLPPLGMPDAEAREAGRKIEAALFDVVADLDGSISAEHGIGRTKRDAFLAGVSSVHHSLISRIKETIDPLGLMNPGCLLPDRRASR